MTGSIGARMLLPLAPFAMAGVALGVREGTRPPVRVPVSVGAGAIQLPPPPWLLPGASPGVGTTFRVDPRASRALVGFGPRSGGAPDCGFRVTGTLRRLADESLSQVDLVLDPPGIPEGEEVPPGNRVTLRGIDAVRHNPGVPGVRTSRLSCRAVVGGEPCDLRFSAAWLRLPGGSLRLQAVATLAAVPPGLPGTRRAPLRLRRREGTVGLDLTLARER